jgi:hypothetical protein
MTTRETVIFLICGVGTLAMSTGAFGLLAGINRQSRGTRWAVPLIGLYSVGIVLNVAALTLAGTWYLAAPMALMLVPAEVALRRHGVGRRSADLSHFK